MSLNDHRETAWAYRELMRMAAADRQPKKEADMRTWRIKFWGWLSAVSHRRLIRLVVKDSRQSGRRLKSFQQRWDADRQRRA